MVSQGGGPGEPERGIFIGGHVADGPFGKCERGARGRGGPECGGGAAGAAANEGNILAAVELGRCYWDGLAVAQDSVEAFKWYTLAAKQTNVAAKDALKDLAAKLRADEVAAGQARANAFVVGQEYDLPEPGFLGKLKLNGITGSTTNRLAIVNNHTMALNETAEIKLDARSVAVKCVAIYNASVVLQVGPYRKELPFRN